MGRFFGDDSSTEIKTFKFLIFIFDFSEIKKPLAASSMIKTGPREARLFSPIEFEAAFVTLKFFSEIREAACGFEYN